MESTSTKEKQAMMVEPQKEHHWLQKFVGEWRMEGQASMAPGEPWEKFSGTEKVRSIGGIWILSEGYGEGEEDSPATVMSLGYDPDRKRFTGSFIALMMTYLWTYEGELDTNEKALTLHTEGPSMSLDKKTTKFREVLEFVNEDHRTWTSWAQGDDGSWQEVMKSHYWRIS